MNADMVVERQTYHESRIGLDSLYNQLQKKYDDECLSKQVRALACSNLKNFLSLSLGCRNRISNSNRTEK